MSQEPFANGFHDFSDEALDAAAKSALGAMMASMPEEPEDHDFSLAFQAKMEKLCVRERRRVRLRRVSRRAAMVALVCVATLGVWIAADTDAKASFSRWFREKYESYVSYSFRGDIEEDAELMLPQEEFEPARLPKGYHWQESGTTNNETVILYQNDSGEQMEFGYAWQAAEYGRTAEDWDVELAGKTRSSVPVGEYAGELFTGTEENILMWTARDTAFYIGASLSEEELFRIAESVHISNRDALPTPDGYRLSILPEGYALSDEETVGGVTTRTYRNAQGREVTFTYGAKLRGEDLFPKSAGKVECGTVNGCKAQLLRAKAPGETSAVLWTDESGGMLCLSGPLEEEELLRVAENAVPVYRALYAPAWVPEGYALDPLGTMGGADSCMTSYVSADSSDVLVFDCFYIHSGLGMALSAEEETCTREDVTVNGLSGDFYQSSREDDSNALIWFDEDAGVSFYLGGELDKDTLLKIAESVAHK